jgi:hypothetical protein
MTVSLVCLVSLTACTALEAKDVRDLRSDRSLVSVASSNRIARPVVSGRRIALHLVEEMRWQDRFAFNEDDLLRRRQKPPKGPSVPRGEAGIETPDTEGTNQRLGEVQSSEQWNSIPCIPTGSDSPTSPQTAITRVTSSSYSAVDHLVGNGNQPHESPSTAESSEFRPMWVADYRDDPVVMLKVIVSVTVSK